MQQPPTVTMSPAAATDRLLPLIYAVTLFLSAALLFVVQPMVAKMALPMLGGTPGVWNTAMVFFQTVLLAGYLYAHVLSRWRSVRLQATVHMGLLLLATAFLPIAVTVDWLPPTGGTPVWWLVALFAVTVGVPFLAVAANAPLLQRWFSRSAHGSAHDPYFLYSASNLGSILALVSYPLLLQPAWTLEQQGRFWGLGFTLLAAGLVVCALAIRPRAAEAASVAPAEAQPAGVGWTRRLHWLALAFVPSSLMLGVTTHITTDIAAGPLFWVVPLTLYLLSFVIVFARRPIVPHRWMLGVQPIVLIGVAGAASLGLSGMLPTFLLHLIAFFVTALVCHGALAQRRPAARHLTEFYLWMSLGGIMGGAFNSLLAPLVFDTVLEYPLVLALACLLRPWSAAPGAGQRRPLILDVLLPVGFTAVALGPHVLTNLEAWSFMARPGDVVVTVVASMFGAVLVWSFRGRPLRLALGVGGLFLLVLPHVQGGSTDIRARSFFGVTRVYDSVDGRERIMVHGSTVHGRQLLEPEEWATPLGYYYREGPLGDVFAGRRAAGMKGAVGLIGLGAGATLCYREPGEAWTVYEIDPLVVRIASDPSLFRYVSSCGQGVEMVVGDGRLSLRREPVDSLDLLIVDAFSSDSVPTHLLTREALAAYRRVLTADGVLAFHVSSRFVDLVPVLAALVRDAGMAGSYNNHQTTIVQRERLRGNASWWVAVARNREALRPIADRPGWRPLPSDPGVRVWTDNYSNLVDVLLFD